MSTASLCASLLRQRSGSATVEFALVAIPFIALTFALLETSVLMFNQSLVQGAVLSAARQIRTGQLQAGPGTSPSQQASVLSTFQTAVCNDIGAAINLTCANLFFDVRTFASFGSISIPAPIFDGQGNVTNTSFNTGGSAGIVTVRVIYVATPITPGLSSLLGAGAGQPLTITYTVVLRNEPF